MVHHFEACLIQNGTMDAAYVIVPIDIRRRYGKGRLKVRATFDGYPYEGSVVNMGLKDARGEVCYILGVTKAVRTAIGKTFGQRVEVAVEPLL